MARKRSSQGPGPPDRRRIEDEVASVVRDERGGPEARVDVLAQHLRAAWDAHAASLRTGDQRAILVAYIAALEAERAVLVDSGGRADLASAQDIEYQIEDERAALARMS